MTMTVTGHPLIEGICKHCGRRFAVYTTPKTDSERVVCWRCLLPPNKRGRR